MSTAAMLLFTLMWGVNAALIALIISLQIRLNREDKQLAPDLEMTEYAYSNGEWVRL